MLVYRSVFKTAREDGRNHLESTFRAWLVSKGLSDDLPVSGARTLAGAQQVYRAGLQVEGVDAVRLALLEPRPGESWRTTVTAVRGQGRPWEIAVDLERTGQGPPPAPRAPRVVADLLGQDTDSPAGTPLRPRAVQVGPEDVDTLLMTLRWAQRDVPVVVAYGTPEAAPSLAKALAGVALVVHLDAAAASRFNDQAGDGYRIRRGAWRTYQPGVGQPDDDPRRHRALGPERIAQSRQTAINLVAGSFRSEAVAKRLPALYRDQVADYPGFRSAERITLREIPAGDPGSAAQLAASEAAQLELIAAVEEVERNLDDERAARLALQRERDDAILDAAVVATDLSSARGRVQFLERELAKVDVRPWELPMPAELPIPGSFEELLEAAESLSLLVLGSGTRSSLELDDHARSSAWVVKAWDGLLMLQSFAEGRTEGFEGNVEQWCRECPPGGRPVPAKALAMTENETVQKNSSMRSARTFDVPIQVAAGGRVAMWPHYKIDNKDPAPRLHFHDDTRGTGKVYVGYLGRHLLSPQTT